MENLSKMCICLHGSGARRPPYTHYYLCSNIFFSNSTSANPQPRMKTRKAKNYNIQEKPFQKN